MGFFSFIQEIAMDLGTANTIIISDDKIVVDEPSVVALDRRTDKMIAVGEKAKMMYEKTHDNIRTIRPLRDGVIADFTACEQMMRGLIKMVHTGSRLFSPSLRMVIGVPSGSTEVELRAVRDSAEHADGRDVYLIFEPMAAAIGIGIDVEAPEGNMIVDIGGGSTEIAVISLGGIVSNNSIRTAGDDLTADIQEYMSRQHNVKVSERMAERIKIHVGSALTDLGDTADIIEKIDIGGISLIRAGAKNFKDVVIVPSKAEYSVLLDILKKKGAETDIEDRKMFAERAFGVSSHYDTAIHAWFAK